MFPTTTDLPRNNAIISKFYNSYGQAVGLILAAFLCCSATSLKAQTFRAGLSAGVIASQVSGDGYGGFDKAGIFAGSFINYYTSENWSLQMEINYAEKGSRKNPNTAEGDHTFFRLRLKYVDVPLLAKVDYNDFTFEFGLYYGRLISYELEDENGVFDLPERSNDFEDNEVGALIGITYNFTDQLLMNWRLNNSIQEIREYDSESEYLLNDGMFNTYLTFSLRYEFIK